MRLRDVAVIGTANTMMNGRMVPVGVGIAGTDTHSPQQRRHPLQLHLTHAEQSNPNEVSGVVDTLSRLTARKTEFLSGKGKGQEAKAARRKATGTHNWADRAGNGDTHAERRLTWSWCITQRTM